MLSTDVPTAQHGERGGDTAKQKRITDKRDDRRNDFGSGQDADRQANQATDKEQQYDLERAADAAVADRVAVQRAANVGACLAYPPRRRCEASDRCAATTGATRCSRCDWRAAPAVMHHYNIVVGGMVVDPPEGGMAG